MYSPSLLLAEVKHGIGKFFGNYMQPLRSGASPVVAYCGIALI